MSKIGKQEIQIPAGVTVTVHPGSISILGKKGEVMVHHLQGIHIEISDSILKVTKSEHSKNKKIDAFWGTQRALIASAVKGAETGYEKKLELEGVGYRATMEGRMLVLSLGLSHPVQIEPPKGIEITVTKNTITVVGADKALVGQVAAKIRAFKKPEPYKGKGIRNICFKFMGAQIYSIPYL